METQRVIKDILEKSEAEGGIKNVCLVACGGSLGAFYPAKTFLETEAKELRVGYYTSNEFVHAMPASFGKNSLLIVTSHRGNTPETVKAAEIARGMGVPVIGLTHVPGSPLTEHCDYVLDYTFGDGKDIAGEKTMVCLLLVMELLQRTEGYAHYDAFMHGVERIDGIVKNACGKVARRALAFADEYKNDPVIYTMGSGAGFGAAYMESICIFMEMQWIHSAAIHTGEFFHGPFEITDADTPFVIQLAEGKTRPLDERALTFLKTYAKRIEVLDAKDLGLSTIDASVVDYFNHSLFNNVYAVYNSALAEARQHPLTTRRYMWKVQY
jgi:Predicted phosphosugar isomerases